MIPRETRLIRRGLGRRPIVVLVLRRNDRRLRRTARAMRAAGRPAAWIARALAVGRDRVDGLIGEACGS